MCSVILDGFFKSLCAYYTYSYTYSCTQTMRAAETLKFPCEAVSVTSYYVAEGENYSILLAIVLVGATVDSCVR